MLLFKSVCLVKEELNVRGGDRLHEAYNEGLRYAI